MRRILIAIAVFEMLALGGVHAGAAPKRAIYLDKLDKELDDWWNTLDGVCRGARHDDAMDLACDQRLALDKIIEKKGCHNIYPATGPHDTSYWVCEPK
jgi:hypothetical protein